MKSVSARARAVKREANHFADERTALFGILHDDYPDLSGVQYAMALDACLNIAYSLDTSVRRFAKIVNAGPDLASLSMSADEVKAFANGIVGRMTARIAGGSHD